MLENSTCEDLLTPLSFGLKAVNPSRLITSIHTMNTVFDFFMVWQLKLFKKSPGYHRDD